MQQPVPIDISVFFNFTLFHCASPICDLGGERIIFIADYIFFPLTFNEGGGKILANLNLFL
jgi:hypothetical protein